jgi:uncharacterized membrane protein
MDNRTRVRGRLAAVVAAAESTARDRLLGGGRAHRVHQAVTVAAPPETVYDGWRDLAPFPAVDIVEDVPGEFIAWRSLAPARHLGRVRFAPAPAGRGTEVRVDASYRTPFPLPPAPGASIEQQVRDRLRRLRSLVECGGVVRVDGQPSGRPAAGQRQSLDLLRTARG